MIQLFCEYWREMEEICKLHAEDWHALKDNYSCALKAKSERLNDKKKKELIALDKWQYNKD